MIKKQLKALTKSDLFILIVARIAWAYIKFVQITSKWTILHQNRIDAYVKANKPAIVVFWHNRLFLNALGWTYDKPFYMLISKHTDGRLISQVMDNFGIDTIAGSTNKDGIAALRTMVTTLKQGNLVGITPDGPRGPRFHISDGVLSLARLSGADIIPGISSIKRRKIMGSWDRFILALPFSKACFVWGKPITLSPDKGAIEDNRQKVYDAMMATCDEADAYCDHPAFTSLPEHLDPNFGSKSGKTTS